MKTTTLKTKITIQFSILFFSCLTIVGYFVYQGMVNVIQQIAITYIQETIKQVNDKIDQMLREVENASSTAVSNLNIQVLLNKHVTYLMLRERTQINELITSAANQNPYVNALQVYTPKYGFYGFNNSILQPIEIRSLIMSNLNTELKDQMVWITSESGFKKQPYILGIRKIPNFINDSGLGYFMAVVNGERIVQDLKKINIGTGGQVFLINESDKLIISSTDISNREMELYTQMVNEQENQGENHIIRNINGEKTLITFSTSDKTKWATVVVLPVSSLTNGIRHIHNILIWGYFISVVLIFISAGVLSSMISRPIRNIQRVMRRVEEGNMNLMLPLTQVSELNDLSNSFNNMVYKLKHLIDQVYESELRQKEAEMKALQAHINPHFLYNTLDSFYWLLMIRKQDDLAKDVVAFSNLFRYSVGNKEEVVSLKLEFEHIRNYLRIQKLRFEKLEISCTLDPEIEHVLTIKMLLQPLVENAIYHGLENKAEQGKLEVWAVKDEEVVIISIQDNGIGIDKHTLGCIRRILNQRGLSVAQEQLQIGIGIENVNSRIKLFHGESYGLEVFSELGIGTLVRVRIPLDIQRRKIRENSAS